MSKALDSPDVPARGLDSLRVRLALTIGVVLLAMLAVTGYQAYRLHQAIVRTALERVGGTAQRVAAEQGESMAHATNLLTFLSRDLARIAEDPGCTEVLAAQMKDESSFAGIAIAARNGDVICSAVAMPTRVNLSDRGYFREALAKPGPVIGEPVLARASEKWALPFAVASRDEAGVARHVLIITLDLEWLGLQLERTRYSGDARLGLIDGSGLVVARYPDPDKWVGRNASQTPFFQALKSREGYGTGEAVGFDGVQRIYGFARFAQTMSGPIYLWVGVSRNSVVGAADRELGWTLAAVLLLLGATLGAAWVGGERLFLRPVSAIADAARRLAGGEPQARTGIAYGKDELGQLAHSFDEMAESLGSTSRLLQANRALHERAQEIRVLNARLEQRVRERTAELEAANKELEAFAYTVSHDLRAPLRAIDGFSKILEEDYGGKVDEEGRDSLHRIRAAAQRMGVLIDDLLQLSRLSRAEMVREPVDLSALAASVAGEIKAAEPARKVVFSIAPGLVVQADRALLKVLLDNLVGNAWKFTSRHPAARIEVGAAQGEDGTAYFVRDDGAGFDMAHAGSLFAPFQRLHGASDFPGTGIGLATVQRIVRRHGGRVWAKGAVDEGATFYFTLVADSAAAPAPEREAAPA